jgi:hypothetical protein
MPVQPPRILQGSFPPGLGATQTRLPQAIQDSFRNEGGQPLPPQIRQRAEAAFGAGFADVRIHNGPEAQAIGAHACTVGSHIYFAPGQYNVATIQGRRILGHELAHVIQQRSGRVRNPFGHGIAIVRNPALEAEADRIGEAAAAMMAGPVQLMPRPVVPHAMGRNSVVPHPVVQRTGFFVGHSADEARHFSASMMHYLSNGRVSLAEFTALATTSRAQGRVFASLEEIIGIAELLILIRRLRALVARYSPSPNGRWQLWLLKVMADGLQTAGMNGLTREALERILTEEILTQIEFQANLSSRKPDWVSVDAVWATLLRDKANVLSNQNEQHTKDLTSRLGPLAVRKWQLKDLALLEAGIVRTYELVAAPLCDARPKTVKAVTYVCQHALTTLRARLGLTEVRVAPEALSDGWTPARIGAAIGFAGGTISAERSGPNSNVVHVHIGGNARDIIYYNPTSRTVVGFMDEHVDSRSSPSTLRRAEKIEQRAGSINVYMSRTQREIFALDPDRPKAAILAAAPKTGAAAAVATAWA